MTSGKKIVSKIGAIFCRKNSPKTPTKDERPKQKGLSIHYLSTTFADEVKVYNRKINTAIIESSDDSYDPFVEESFSEESSSEEIETNYINSTKIKVYELEDLNNDKNGFIRAKGENVVCPRDGKLGAAFVDCVQGEDNVGIANIMISYSWGETIEDIIDVLEQFVARKKLDRKRSYVWICCLCNNQHRVVDRRKNNKEVPFEEFKDTFESQVNGVDHIVALMSPWDKPQYLTRVWCVFEMHTAYKNGRDISIEIPSGEREKFKETAMNLQGSSKFLDLLGNTKIEDAEASVEADKVNILNLVRAEVGTATLNNDVNTLYRKWIVTCLNTIVSELDEKLKEDKYGGMSVYSLLYAFNNIGDVFYEAGEYESAMDCFKNYHELCSEEFGSTHVLVTLSYNNLARVHHYLKEYDQAIEFYKKCIAISEDIYGPDYFDNANGYFNIGLVYIEKKEWEKALEYLEQCREINEKILGKENYITASVYVPIGEVLAEKGDYDTALKLLDDTLDLRKKTIENFDQTIEAAETYSAIGRAHEKKGDIDMALDYYSMSLRIYEKVHGANHPETIKVYNRISSSYEHKGDAAKALEYSQKAKQEE
jgi:tetratricopeptide (TPR) repeat protein